MTGFGFGSPIPYAEPLWYSRGLTPYYNESHRRLRKFAREYVDQYILPNCEQWERDGHVPPEAVKQHADHGFMAILIRPLPKEYLDGQKLPADIHPDEWDGFHGLIASDELVRCGYLGITWALGGGNAIGCPPIVNFGTEEQKRKWLPDVLKGKKRFCLGVTEPDAGSDVAGITTTAKRRGNHYIVNGSKKWITNGIFADYCTTVVRTGGPGRRGISVLVIPLDAKGITRRKIENSGVSASGSAFIEFDDVEVPCENLIGRENAGFEIVMSNFNHERLSLAAGSLRLARVCAEDSILYAMTRSTFGSKLIENQAIRAKISSFGREIESAHAHLEQIIWMLEQEKRKPSPAAATIPPLIANLKILAGRVLEHTNREAQQIMGGVGYAKGGNGRGARVEQISRDVRVMVVGGGSEEILSDLVVRMEAGRVMSSMAGKTKERKL